jgi:hypothetical protein
MDTAMHTSDIYAVMVKELEAAAQLPVSELVALASQPARQHAIEISGERIEFELSISWKDKTEESVRVTCHARGPSTWHTEHLQESITVSVSAGATNGA